MLLKITLGLILLLSLLANIGAFLLIKHLYLNTNLVRLDPLQLNTYQQEAPVKLTNSKRVVFFGDSRALSWPVPKSPAFAEFEFINRGIGNQTSEQIRLRYEKHVAPLNADIIVLQLCVNDLKVIPLKPALRTSIVSQCKNNVLEIIHKARQQGTTVILSTVFPLGVVPLERKLLWSDDVAASINEVNEFIMTQAKEDVVIFDSYQILSGQKGRIRPEYSRDLLHLNDRGYDVLNQKLSERLISMK